MKRLILMRHAKSDWNGAGVSDHDRTLSKRGQANAASLGIWLAEKELLPDMVLCSTATRTRETLDQLALQGNPKIVFSRALYLADAEELLAALKDAKGETVLLIGHNPGIGEMAELIVNTPPNSDGIRHYPTGATMVSTFDVDSWEDVAWHMGHVSHIVGPRELPLPE